MIRFRLAIMIVFLLMFPFGESIVSKPYFNNTTLKLSNDTTSGLYIQDHTTLNTDGTEKTYLQSQLGAFNSKYTEMSDTGYIQIGNFGSKSNLIVRAKEFSHFGNTNCQKSANPVGEPNPDYVYTCNTVEEACICAQATYQGYIGLSPLDIRDATYTTLTLKDSSPTNPTKTIMLNFETHPHIQINAFNQYINENKSATLNLKATTNPLYFPRHEGAPTGATFASCLKTDGSELLMKNTQQINNCSFTGEEAISIHEGALQFDSINATFGNIRKSNSEIDDNLNTHYVRLHFGLVENDIDANDNDISINLNHTLDATQTETHQYSKKGTSGKTGYLTILSFTATANTSTSLSGFNANINAASTPAGSPDITNIIIDIPGEIDDCDSTQTNTLTCN